MVGSEVLLLVGGSEGVVPDGLSEPHPEIRAAASAAATRTGAVRMVMSLRLGGRGDGSRLGAIRTIRAPVASRRGVRDAVLGS
jgi:hypothetical protein